MVVIGIPVHNDKECFGYMIDSLMKSTNSYDEIIIIESESTDGCQEDCESLEEEYSKIRVDYTKKEGPLKAYNRLFDYAIKNKQDLLITQTDVGFPKLFNRDWLAEMKEISKKEKVGAVTCINGTGISGPDYINGLEWLGGWCTYYTYEALKKIGGYDEKYPKGYAVDIDHTFKLFKEGFKIYKINYWVDHHMANERLHDNDPKSEEYKKEASKYFKKKWGIKC